MIPAHCFSSGLSFAHVLYLDCNLDIRLFTSIGADYALAVLFNKMTRRSRGGRPPEGPVNARDLASRPRKRRLELEATIAREL